MAVKLFVGGLSWDTTEDSLRQAFSQMGTVVSASVIMDKYTGKSKGFGFVEMSSDEEAQNAIKELNDCHCPSRCIVYLHLNYLCGGSSQRIAQSIRIGIFSRGLSLDFIALIFCGRVLSTEYRCIILYFLELINYSKYGCFIGLISDDNAHNEAYEQH